VSGGVEARIKAQPLALGEKIFSLPRGEKNRQNPPREVLGNNRQPSQEGGCSLGYVSTIDSKGRDIFVADAHRDGMRFIVRADDPLTAFIELERQVLTVTFYLESIQDDSRP